MSPFFVVYGKQPPSIPQYITGSSHIGVVDSELIDHECILSKLKAHLERVQARQNYYFDLHRIDHPFKVGDLVMVKLRPYCQFYVESFRNQKLAQRFYGPFPIIKRVQDVAFELQLHAGSKIHHVFHISKLKPFMGGGGWMMFH